MTTTLDAVRQAIVNLGYEAEPVQNSPVDAINVWAKGENRIPAATVIHDLADDVFAWGPSWEWEMSDDHTAHAVAIAVERTIHGNAIDEPLVTKK